jgi:hypothetical protein
VVSSDGGSTWEAIGPQLPFRPAGVVYSAQQKAFFIWHWDCANRVLPDAIARLSYDFGGVAAPPAEVQSAPTSVVPAEPPPSEGVAPAPDSEEAAPAPASDDDTPAPPGPDDSGDGE